MRIQKLDIKNFRGFEELTIEFPKQGPVVFIGGNGSGKSSVLDLVNYALEVEIIVPTRSFSQARASFTDFDVNLKSDFFVYKYGIVFGGQLIEKEFNYKIGENSRSRYNEKDEFLGKVLESANSETNFPTFIYYPTHRKLSYGSQENKRFLLPQHKTYEDAFLKEANFVDFIFWFVEEENKENREKIKQKDLELTSPGLDTIRNGLKAFFQNFPSENYHNLRVEEREFNKVTNIPSSLVITKGDKDLNLAQLSDGEKMVITLVADIARRLTIANPSLEDKLQGEGIVLIDEIELHLHPSWQRNIIPALTKTFPNIQFIVTTHSPQVISTVQKENVFLLEDFKIKEIPASLGRDSNSILEEVFLVPERPEGINEKLEKVYKLLDNPEKIEEARVLLKEIEEAYEVSRDKEFMLAKMELELLDK